MALYLIGDIQGCDEALQRLLDTLAFSPSRDTIYLLGDLVNRGPASAAVLRRLMHYGPAARCLLGNHDLHLLAVSLGKQKTSSSDTLQSVLLAPDRNDMLHWLRHQRLAMLETIGDLPLLMVHAGVLPAWTAIKTIAYAQEVESALQSVDTADFFHALYGNTPDTWSDALTGADRTRVIVNALTRLRFCTLEGAMEFDTKDSAHTPPPGYMPWFDIPGRQTADIAVAFGHWSTLGWLGRSDVLAMDTGCLWGGCLSALRIQAAGPGQPWNTELVQVQCPQTQKPGASSTNTATKRT
jgi:bis(5'-nucleosyl)-tetraphosphatase (symmetrical)